MTRPWRSAALTLASVLVAAALAPGALGASRPHSTGTNVTTYDYSNSRNGDDPEAVTITGLSADPRWARALDGAVYGEPLVYDGEAVVATENDSVYGLSLATGKVLWRDHVGTAVRTSVIDSTPTLYSSCGDINPLGITGTPVIDPATGELYAVAETMVGRTRWQDVRHELIGVSLSTHRMNLRRDIDPPGGNQASKYYIPAEQQRPALTLANGRVYVGLGGLAGDCGQYHGFEVSVPESGSGAESVFQVPSAREGAIWATNGAYVDPEGDLYVASGNGSSTSTYDGGNTLFELSPALKVLGRWAPDDWETLNAQDWDLGSAGPIPVPGTDEIFIAGKPADGSFGYLVTAGALGDGPAAPVFKGDVCSSGTAGVFGADASDVVDVSGAEETFIYAACGSGTEALRYSATPEPSFTQAWADTADATDGPPIVAGGLVFALNWNGDQLAVLNAGTGQMVATRTTSPLNHFATPTVADGYVLVPTQRGLEAFATLG